MKRAFPALAACLLASSALAQAPSPASMGITSGAPQSLQYLDQNKRWVPVGAITNGLDPRQFGAKCDAHASGTTWVGTDDTAALQAWAAALTPGSSMFVPSPGCITRSPLVFPAANDVTFFGSGRHSSRLIYSGTDTTPTLFTFGTVPVDPASCTSQNWDVHDVGFYSTTTMTAGDGVIYNGFCSSTFTNTNYGGAYFVGTNDQTLFNGVHFNRGNVLKVSGIETTGHNAGTGIILNGGTKGTPGPNQLGGPMFDHFFVGGYNVGVDIAGNVGGTAFGAGDFINNNTNVSYSQHQVPVPNTQVVFGSLTNIDITYSGVGIDISDPGGPNSYVMINGAWIASSYSHNIWVHAGSTVMLSMNGGKLNNAGRVGVSSNADGLRNDSTVSKIQINNTLIANNYGFGVNSTVANPNVIVNGVTMVNNTLGNFSPNVQPLSWNADSAGLTTGPTTTKNPLIVTGPAGVGVQFKSTGSQPVDQHNWDIFETSTLGDFNIRACKDDYTACNVFFELYRGNGIGLTATANANFFVPVSVPGYLVANLPSCGAGDGGKIVFVSDATAPAWNVALVGGGAVHTLALCNGATWVAH